MWMKPTRWRAVGFGKSESITLFTLVEDKRRRSVYLGVQWWVLRSLKERERSCETKGNAE